MKRSLSVLNEELSFLHHLHDGGDFPGCDCSASNPMDLVRRRSAITCCDKPWIPRVLEVEKPRSNSQDVWTTGVFHRWITKVFPTGWNVERAAVGCFRRGQRSSDFLWLVSRGRWDLSTCQSHQHELLAVWNPGFAGLCRCDRGCTDVGSDAQCELWYNIVFAWNFFYTQGHAVDISPLVGIPGQDHQGPVAIVDSMFLPFGLLSPIAISNSRRGAPPTVGPTKWAHLVGASWPTFAEAVWLGRQLRWTREQSMRVC